MTALDERQGLREYKKPFQDRIQALVDQHLDDIPLVVEDIPVVAMHTDMGLHNIIVSSETSTESRASSICLPSFNDREAIPPSADDLFGPELDRADELPNAFSEEILYWKQQNESTASKLLL
ncbi:MAG: hypothetical protein Q9198_003948 [Flavoplaca austrocitrina]